MEVHSSFKKTPICTKFACQLLEFPAEPIRAHLWPKSKSNPNRSSIQMQRNPTSVHRSSLRHRLHGQLIGSPIKMSDLQGYCGWGCGWGWGWGWGFGLGSLRGSQPKSNSSAKPTNDFLRKGGSKLLPHQMQAIVHDECGRKSRESRGIEGIQGNSGASGPSCLWLDICGDCGWPFSCCGKLSCSRTQNGVHVANRNSVKLLTWLAGHF